MDDGGPEHMCSDATRHGEYERCRIRRHLFSKSFVLLNKSEDEPMGVAERNIGSVLLGATLCAHKGWQKDLFHMKHLYSITLCAHKG